MRNFMKGCLGALVFLVAAPILFVVLVGVFVNPRVGTEVDFSASASLATRPAVLAEPRELKIVTYNIQDLYPVAVKPIAPRMRGIGQYLTTLDPDIVGFQESFDEENRAVLIESMKGSRLQHHHYFSSGVVGSGLLISSAFPIEEKYFHRYSASNPAWKLWEGDWWAGKGMGLARVALPGGGLIDFYNTHAQAGYGNPGYRIVRKQQMQEAAKFINDSRTGTAPAFVVGDFNCRIGNDDMNAVVDGAGLEHVMSLDSGIDLVFAVRDPDYTFEVLDTVKIDGSVEYGGRSLPYSDHAGWMTTVRVVPAPGVEAAR